MNQSIISNFMAYYIILLIDREKMQSITEEGKNTNINAVENINLS